MFAVGSIVGWRQLTQGFAWVPGVRAGIGGITLIAFLLTAGGLPTPAALSIPSGERFPCEQHRCGCASAQKCWSDCCCFTHKQKLAWAKANNVTPPAEFMLAESNSSTTDSCSAKTKSCCAAKVTKSCCGGGKTSASPRPETDEDWAIEAQKCRGVATNWVTLGAIACDAIATRIPVHNAPGEILPLVNESAVIQAIQVPSPPPNHSDTA